MSLSNCPECGNPLSSTAESCPKCGHKQIKKQSSSFWPAIIVAVILLLFMFNMCGNDSDDGDGSFKHDENTAYHHAEDAVQKLLKSPKTAEFPDYGERQGHVTSMGDEYIINSYVDSQNGFGALIRTKWKCKVTYNFDKVSVTEIEFP